MKQTIGRRILERFGFYLGALVLAAAVYGIQTWLQSGSTIYPAVPMQEKAVDAFLEMNRLLTTLATTLLGAMGFMLFGGLKGNPCSRELWAAITGALSVGLSIYYGYAAYLTVTSMLATGPFDPYDPLLKKEQYAHFYSFLIGVILFAGFVYQNMRTEDGHE